MEKLFGFDLALLHLKAGFEVTRKGWYETEAKPTVLMQRPDENSKMTEPYLYMTKNCGKNVFPYLYMTKNCGKNVFPLDLSCESIMAEDWMLCGGTD